MRFSSIYELSRRRQTWVTSFERRRRAHFVLNWSQILLILRLRRLISRRRRLLFFWEFESFEFVENRVNLEFFLQIETIRNDVFDFITFMTNEMRMIRAFSFFFVDVFSTIFRLWFIIKRVFIISILLFFSILVLRRLEVNRTTVKRRLNVDCLLHVILQTIR
jgi:hypothetical protein